MIKTFEDMIELMHTYWGGDDEVHKDLDRLLELHNTEIEQIRADAVEEFAHSLKETFNNEFPRNYHCTQPYFTLDNVRVLVDVVAKEAKEQK